VSGELVERRRGDPLDDDAPEQDKERGPAERARGADDPGSEEAQAGWPPDGSDETPIRIRYRGVIVLRKVRIDPRSKRREYVRRLENVISVCEKALSDADALQEIQIKAAEVIIKAIRASYAIIREEEVENLEQLAQEIKAKLEERARPS